MAERSKALRSGRSLVLQAWVRIPLLTNSVLYILHRPDLTLTLTLHTNVQRELLVCKSSNMTDEHSLRFRHIYARVKN